MPSTHSASPHVTFIIFLISYIILKLTITDDTTLTTQNLPSVVFSFSLWANFRSKDEIVKENGRER